MVTFSQRLLAKFEFPARISNKTCLKLSLVTKLGFHVVFLQIETCNPINLIIVDNFDKKAGQLID